MNLTTIITLSAVAVALIAVDFYLPGFVLATIGIVLMFIAVGIAWYVYGITLALWIFIGEAFLGVAAGYFSIKLVPQTAFGKRMFLHETQAGVRAQTTVAPQLIGRSGVAKTVLRPAGVAEVDGKRLDVVAESGMIASGEPITVIAVQENRIVVRKV